MLENARVEVAEKPVAHAQPVTQPVGVATGLDAVGQGMEPSGVLGRAVVRVRRGGVLRHHERPVAAGGEERLTGQLVELRSTRWTVLVGGFAALVDNGEQPALHLSGGGGEIPHLLTVPDTPVLAGAPRAR